MWAWLDDAVRSVVARGTLLRATRAKRLVVQVQLLNGEVADNVEVMQPYGFSSVPTGGDVVMLTVGGVRDHKIVLVIDDPARRIRDLAAGELGIGDGASQVVVRGWGLDLSTPGALKAQVDGAATVTAAAISLGALNAVVRKLVDERFVPLYNGHTHGGIGAPPSQLMSVDNHTTTTMKAQ